MRNTRVTRYCLKCGKEMKVALWRLRKGHGKFCSKGCGISYNHKGLPKPKSKVNVLKAIETHKGKPAWNSMSPIDLICKYCGKSFQVRNPRKNIAHYCSRICSDKGRKKFSLRGKDFPTWTRILMKCKWCGKEVYVPRARWETFICCSYECHGSYSVRQANKISKPESIISEALTNLGLNFLPQYRIGKYACDFVLLDYKLVIEADGDYWHSLPESIERDKIKDKFLKDNGWVVLRFKESAIKKNLSKCLVKINRYINFNSMLLPRQVNTNTQFIIRRV